MHVNKKLERNQNEDENNYRSLWQGEWKHLLMFTLFRIVPCFEQQLSLHALSSLKHTYTKFGWIGSTMKTSTKVQKLFLLMKISIHFCVWWRKRWKIFFYMWVPLSDVIIAMISWSISWVVVHSLPHGQSSKWIPKSLMVWSHWHLEKCVIVGCGILRWIQSAIRKWAEDKWNEGVLRWTNNQAPIVGLAQEQRCACEIFKGTFVRCKVNSCLCNWSIKKKCIWR
jgi:hypothetical protein